MHFKSLKCICKKNPRNARFKIHIIKKKKITTCPLEELDWIRYKTVRISFGKTLQMKKKEQIRLIH